MSTPEEVKKHFKKMFNGTESKAIKVALDEIGRFNLKVIQWKAVEAGLCLQEQWLVYKLTGVEYIENCPYIIVEFKTFDETSDLDIEIEVDGELHLFSLTDAIPPDWRICSKTNDG